MLAQMHYANKHRMGASGPANTLDQMSHMVKGMDGKRLRYEDLIADEAA